MTPEILICILSGTFTLVGVIITSVISNNTTKWRIEQLEKKVDKHNNVIERTYKLEQQVSDLERNIKC